MLSVVPFEEYDLPRMKLWNRVVARRRSKAHQAYLRERDRQRELQSQDVEDAMRRVSVRSNANMQGGSLQ
jgi:hypothetical protein